MGDEAGNKNIDSRVFLPPCKVCGEQAAGYHYGVNTCEACKGFFHRSLRRYKEYACRANRTSGYCDYKPGKRKSCQYCRYQKCLDVGMSKGAIKTGRYTYVKKTEDTKEIQRLKTKVLKKSLKGHSSEVKTFHLLGTDLSSEESRTSDLMNENDLSDTSFSRETNPDVFNDHVISEETANSADLNVVASGNNKRFTKLTNCKEANSKTAAISSVSSAINRYKTELINRIVKSFALHQKNVSHSLACEHQSGSELTHRNLQSSNAEVIRTTQCCLKNTRVPTCPIQEQVSGNIFSSSFTFDDISKVKLNGHTFAQDLEHHFSSESTQFNAESMIGGFEHISGEAEVSTQFSRDETIALHILGEFINTPGPKLTSPSGQQKLSPVQSLLTAPSPTSPGFMTSPLASPSHSDDVFYQAFDRPAELTASSVHELFVDRDHIIALLTESHKENVRDFQDFNLIPKDEIRRQQQAHYEACRLKNKTFGRLDFLPEKEYDDIYSVTGMDIDDRRRVISNYLTKMEKCVRSIVQFAKSIPGFSCLDVNTQVELIKSSRSEFAILTTYPTVNLELGVTIGLCGYWTCRYESDKIGTDVAIKDYMKFADALQKLDPTYEETVLLKAITVMATDRDVTIVSPIAEAIHWELCQCLLHCLRSRRQHSMKQWAKYITVLTQIRTVSDQFQDFLKTLKLDKYSSIEQNPLMLELFSSVIREAGDEEPGSGKRDFSEEKNISILPAVLCTCQRPPPTAD